MAHPRRLLIPLILVVGALACGGDDRPVTPVQPGGSLSAEARAYLNRIVDLMQANSLKRLSIDWTTFRATVLDAAGSAQTIPDTYEAIRTALGLLGDGHSYFQRPTGGPLIFVRTRTCVASAGADVRPTLPATVGYVKVAGFLGSGPEATAFAARIQNEIMTADRDGLAGWIVDLRGNTGGNMWPMIAGVGPVLGEGVLGYFVDPTGAETMWEYRDGASWLNGAPVERVAPPYRLRREMPRVAVLLDNGIVSSGEATAVAFRRRPDTRSFGVATCGFSTAVRGFPMSDGGVLGIAVAVMADRTKTQYPEGIAPDEIVSDPSEMVAAAVRWLEGR